MVVGPRRRHGRIKFEPRNVSRTPEGRSAYLGRAIVIGRSGGVETESDIDAEDRMQRERWMETTDEALKSVRTTMINV